MKDLRKKGFTLVELIIAIALSLIIFATLFSFFFSTNTMFKNINESNTLQNDGEKTINIVSTHFMNASDIIEINSIPIEKSSHDPIDVNSIYFHNKYNENLQCFKVENNRLLYRATENEQWESISNYINKLFITLLKDKDNKKVIGVNIKILLIHSGYEKEFSNQVYFRN